jgi:hypothetical protein
MADRTENQKMAENLVYQILARYAQKLTLDPEAIDELTDKERDFLRMVWQSKAVEDVIVPNDELIEMDDEELSETFKNLKIIDGKL